MEAIETFMHNGKTVEIHVDQDGSASNPATVKTLERSGLRKVTEIPLTIYL
jgi:collagenase-like PrtC family protease